MAATQTNPLRVGLRQERVISPQCLVIFGASGDLTHRKLIPALFELFRQRRLPTEFAVLGCARRPWSDEDFRSRMAEALADEVKQHQSAWQQFAACLFYEPVDLQQDEDVVRLGTRLEAIDRQRATRGNRTFYLSVSPAFYGRLPRPGRRWPAEGSPRGLPLGVGRLSAAVRRRMGGGTHRFRWQRHYRRRRDQRHRFRLPGAGSSARAGCGRHHPAGAGI